MKKLHHYFITLLLHLLAVLLADYRVCYPPSAWLFHVNITSSCGTGECLSKDYILSSCYTCLYKLCSICNVSLKCFDMITLCSSVSSFPRLSVLILMCRFSSSVYSAYKSRNPWCCYGNFICCGGPWYHRPGKTCVLYWKLPRSDRTDFSQNPIRE